MTPLESVRDALRAASSEALAALQAAAVRHRHLAPSFTAWVKHMVDWELDRRAGVHYAHLVPDELVDRGEFARGAVSALARMDAGAGNGGGRAPGPVAVALARLLCTDEPSNPA
jgi:hypothetical protein